jgi:hypothetical protein
MKSQVLTALLLEIRISDVSCRLIREMGTGFEEQYAVAILAYVPALKMEAVGYSKRWYLSVSIHCVTSGRLIR